MKSFFSVIFLTIVAITLSSCGKPPKLSPSKPLASRDTNLPATAFKITGVWRTACLENWGSEAGQYYKVEAQFDNTQAKVTYKYTFFNPEPTGFTDEKCAIHDHENVYNFNYAVGKQIREGVWEFDYANTNGRTYDIISLDTDGYMAYGDLYYSDKDGSSAANRPTDLYMDEIYIQNLQ
jgi:hypothetical protein